MFYLLLIICGFIILMVVLLKKFVLKVDYSEYSKENNRLEKMIKTETLPEDDKDDK